MARRTRTFLSAGAALLLLFGTQPAAACQQPRAARPPGAASPSRRQPIRPSRLPIRRPTSTPLFRTGINFVRVDVIVSDRSGNPVADLKQSDFEVVEDGKPQTVETFKLIKLDGGTVPTSDTPVRQIRTDEDEQAEAAKDDVRLFAIFLDDYHVRRGASMTAGNPLARFVETQLGPSDMIGVMRPLDSVDSVRMTRNHSIITRAIQQFRGRKFDYQPQNDFEQRYANYPAETVEQIRNQVSLSAMKALIVHMGGLKEGRKALIVVSEGYSNTLPPQLRDQIASIPGFGNPNRGNPTAGENNPNEDRYRVLRRPGPRVLHAGRLRGGEPEQRRHLYRRSSRSAGVRVRHQRRRRHDGRFELSQVGAGDAARARARDRRPGDSQPQRSGRRHEADHARLERLLPARLHLAPAQDRRQVPLDQRPRQTAGRAGARPARATGRSRPRWPRRSRRLRRSRPWRRKSRRRCRPSVSRRVPAWCAPGSAHREARTERPGSRSCGSRWRERPGATTPTARRRRGCR